MKDCHYSRPLTALIISSIFIFTSCQLQPVAISPSENLTDNILQVQRPVTPVDNISLASGYEIPECNVPSLWGVEDIIMGTPGTGVTYRRPVKQSTVLLGDTPTAPIIKYRDNIESRAGETRYNLLYVAKPDEHGTWRRGEFEVELRTLQRPNQIRLYNCWAGYKELGYYLFILGIEIPRDVKPGDYLVQLLVFIDDSYYGMVPCAIHVTK